MGSAEQGVPAHVEELEASARLAARLTDMFERRSTQPRRRTIAKWEPDRVSGVTDDEPVPGAAERGGNVVVKRETWGPVARAREEVRVVAACSSPVQGA